MERVRGAGLTVELLEVRVAEGRAKNVPAERIADVVERRAEALIAASEVLRGLSSRIPATELAAGADAVEAGIPPSAIRQVAREARAEDRQIAISVLTYLHRERALPLDVAIQNVSAALQRGSAALRELPSAGASSGGDRSRNEGRGEGAGGSPAASGSSGAGRQPGGGPPAGVPGPENRGGGAAENPGRGGGSGPNPSDGGPGASGPQGRGPDGNGPPGRGPGGGGPPGQRRN